METVFAIHSRYRVTATHMITGQQDSFDILAMDAGEALDKVESHGIWAADDAVLAEDQDAAL